MTDLAWLRSECEAAAARGEVTRAAVLLRELWQADPSSATAGFAVRSWLALDEAEPAALGLTPLRVFFLATYTIEPMLPLLRASAYAAGIRLVLGQGGFNDAVQLALDPKSALYAFEPQLVFVVQQTRDVSPALFREFASLGSDALQAAEADVLARLDALISAVRSHSRARVVVHSLDSPADASLGILDAWAEISQRGAIQRVNVALAARARELGAVYLLDSDAVLRRRGSDHVLDERRFAAVGLPFASNELLAWVREWLRFIHPCAGRLAKVVVCDLDNTLWGGVVGEDGFDGIQLGKGHKGAPFAALQRALLDLKARGILIALCSKNNPEDALEVFARHPDMQLRLGDVAAHRINWRDKADNLRELAQELNLGLDSFVFVDDNPVERAAVRSQLPEVHVLELPSSPLGYASALRACALFERLTLTAEDRERTRMVTAERERQELHTSSHSLEDFLRSLQQQVRVADATRAALARVAQLTQKTNQFNLTTRRYAEVEIEALMQRADHALLTLEVRDRFGEHGLVGLAILRCEAREAELDTFLLSCRVLSRGVETALLAASCERARALGAERLYASFVPTRKNAPAAEFLPKHGFRCVDTQSRYALDLRESVAWPAFIARLDPQVVLSPEG
jgi:FkbH-like protein